MDPSAASGSPSPMHEPFGGGEERFVDGEADENDDKDDTDDLIHGMKFPAVVQQLAKTEAAENGDVNFGRHEGAPGEGPTLFHPANDKRKRGRQNHFEPYMQAF